MQPESSSTHTETTKPCSDLIFLSSLQEWGPTLYLAERWRLTVTAPRWGCLDLWMQIPPARCPDCTHLMGPAPFPQTKPRWVVTIYGWTRDVVESASFLSVQLHGLRKRTVCYYNLFGCMWVYQKLLEIFFFSFFFYTERSWLCIDFLPSIIMQPHISICSL